MLDFALEEIALVMLVSMLPILELRGGIPLAVSMGLNPAYAVPLIMAANVAVFFPIFLALNLLYRLVRSRLPLAESMIKLVRRRGEPYVRRYGFIGLVLFVGLPLPVTGVYSGTVLSWVLGLSWTRAFLAVGLGVVLAGAIVTGFTLGVSGLLRAFG